MYKQKKNNQTSFLLDKSYIKTPTSTNLKSFSSLSPQKKLEKDVLKKNVIIKTTDLPKRNVKVLNDVTNLEKKQLLIVRSKCFGGQLNKSWVNKDLYRYELNFSQLHLLGGAESTNLNRAVTTRPKVKTGLINGSITNLASYLLTAAGIAEAKTTTQPFLKEKLEPRKNNILPFGCLYLDKIILHSNSGKLLQVPSSSAIMDLAFSTISCQTPVQIYSRKSIAGFKLTKSALLGVKSTLRGLTKLEFYYKWYFLGASAPKIAQMHFSSKNASQKADLPYSHRRTAASKGAKQNVFLARLKRQKQLRPYKTSGLNKYSGAIFYEGSALSSSLAIQNVFVFTELDRLDYDYFSTLSGFEIFFVKNF